MRWFIATTVCILRDNPYSSLYIMSCMEIINPGGIYGRITANQLGKVQSDTSNTALATVLELLKFTENRYSGIPTMRRELKKAHMPEPEFLEQRGSFIVRFYKAAAGA